MVRWQLDVLVYRTGDTRRQGGSTDPANARCDAIFGKEHAVFGHGVNVTSGFKAPSTFIVQSSAYNRTMLGLVMFSDGMDDDGFGNLVALMG